MDDSSETLDVGWLRRLFGWRRRQPRVEQSASREPVAAEPPERLVTTQPFALTPELEQRIRADFAERVKHQPTSEQWKMILAASRNQCVNAGAGSGKSTSLIRRVLVLHHYLGIPLSDITVFSFTRASTQEFREKLKKEFERWDIVITDETARSVIRTFHSKLLQFESNQPKLFDLMGSEQGASRSSADDRALVGLSELKVSELQIRYLREAYENVYSASPEVRTVVDELRRIVIRRAYLKGAKKEYQPWQVAKAADADYEITNGLGDVFAGEEHAPCMMPVEVQGEEYQLYANLYFEHTGVFAVYLPATPELGERATMQIGGLPLASYLKMKARILALYCGANFRIVRTAREKRLLIEEMETARVNPTRAPPFQIAPDGIKEDWVWKVLYAEGQFVESMGCDVGEYCGLARNLDGVEKLFVHLLRPFWAELRRLLKSVNLVRFADIFASIRRDKLGANAFKHVKAEVLLSMSHVLVDEFQDISPEVAVWIKDVLAANRDHGVETSLMCVGDDWQSIYGWRGSSPHFIMDYGRTFDAPEHKSIILGLNFRSHQEIIAMAEEVLGPVRKKSDKAGKSRVPGGGTIEFRETESEDDILVAGEELVRDWHDLGKNEEEAKKSAIYVLARSNRQVELARAALRTLGSDLFRFETFHRSKGLEADFCLLIGECWYDGRTPTRNLAYRLAGFEQSYDVAQQDEAMRLAYVGLTRARHRVIWLAKPKGGAFDVARRGSPM